MYFLNTLFDEVVDGNLKRGVYGKHVFDQQQRSLFVQMHMSLRKLVKVKQNWMFHQFLEGFHIGITKHKVIIHYHKCYASFNEILSPTKINSVN